MSANICVAWFLILICWS